ncbi:hypothetical protein Pan216_47730 [Planctomycetes bacterium Pan216]|uniref:Uncharacterized protein n=1 Tax=Kolteria novifilia TaxID=2527975 RepID=A0A518BA83_9BACT|nr:hypothetical protein Pan216_47730 [Planctomycetes bacterium Pan216]
MALSLLASRAAGPLSSLRKFFSAATRKSTVADTTFGRATAEVEALNDRIVPASFGLAGGNLIVELEANEALSLKTIGDAGAGAGGVLSITSGGSTFSGTNVPDEVVGDGLSQLQFANDGGIDTLTIISNQTGTSFNIGNAQDGVGTSKNFELDLDITFNAGGKLTNDGAFAFDSTSDLLTVDADGVNFTQTGADASLTLLEDSTIDLGETGDLSLTSKNNDFGGLGSDLTLIVNNATLVDTNDIVFKASKVSGNLDVTANKIYDALNDGIVVTGSSNLEATDDSNVNAKVIRLNEPNTSLLGPVSATATGKIQLWTLSSDLLLDEITSNTGLVELRAQNISQTEGGFIDTTNEDDTVAGGVNVSSSTLGDIILNSPDNNFDSDLGGFFLVDDVAGSSIFNSVDVFTQGDLAFDNDNDVNGPVQIKSFLGLGAELDVISVDNSLTVFGLTSVTSGGEVGLGDTNNEFSQLKVVQTDPELPVTIGDATTLSFWGSIAGKLDLEALATLTLGEVAPLGLMEAGGTLTAGGIEILDQPVDLGTGETVLDATFNTPVAVSSPNSTGVLFVGDGGSVEILDGVKVGAGSILAGDGLFDVGSAGIAVDPMGTVAAANVSPLGLITPGSLEITGDLGLAEGAIFGQEIMGTADGEFDTIAVDGTADITGATLFIATEGYSATIGDTFTILTADVVTGTFGNLDENDQLTVNGVTYQVTTTATSVALEVVAVSPTVQADGIGLYRPSAAEFVFNTSDVFNFDPNAFFTIGFGQVGDQGFIGDFTGDGIVNVALYRDVSDTEPGFFIINTSPINSFDPDAFITTPFIGNGDEVPFAGDWDGDGDDDLGLYRNVDATYVTINLPEIAPGQTGEVALGLTRNIVFGNPSSPTNPTDPPAVGNFNAAYAADQIGFGAQGTLDMADVDIATLPAGNSSISAFFQPSPLVFGTTGDVQLNGNYTADENGLDQRGLYRSESATFSISSGSQPNIVFGLVGDQGLTGNFVGLPLPVVPATESLIDSFFEEV